MNKTFAEQMTWLVCLLASGLGSVWALTNLGFGATWVIGAAVLATIGIALSVVVATLRDDEAQTLAPGSRM